MPNLGELHVWAFSLDPPPAALANAWRLLTPPERARLERIVVPAARNRRVAARAGMRLLLASYLQVDPRRVELAYGSRGRPELAGGELSFNLSHTANLAVLAVGRGRTVGVDVESLERTPPRRGLIERTLDPGECARVLRVAGGHARTEAFLRHWTVKEAYAKALGVGLALDFRQVGVRAPAARPRLALPPDAGEWRARCWRPRADVVGAVVADGGPWRMRLRECSPWDAPLGVAPSTRGAPAAPGV